MAASADSRIAVSGQLSVRGIRLGLNRDRRVLRVKRSIVEAMMGRSGEKVKGSRLTARALERSPALPVV
jgi:hypothetical protein